MITITERFLAGRPVRCEEIRKKPLQSERIAQIVGFSRRHLTDTAELKGDHIAVLEMRKHVGWYLKGRPGAAAFRDQVNRIDDLEELKNAIDGIL